MAANPLEDASTVPSSLATTRVGDTATIGTVTGPRAFRRRLLELGLVPGTEVRIVRRAPLGDPLELAVRGGRLSLRAREAASILTA